jgi:translation initiation factor 2B subunit (eIF-2B alpha/beta/delta family)
MESQSLIDNYERAQRAKLKKEKRAQDAKLLATVPTKVLLQELARRCK